MCVALAAWALSGVAAAQDVEVIGIRPLPGLGTPLPAIPSSVQSVGSDALESSTRPDVAQPLTRSLAGVSAGDSIGNPLQPTLSYRGFLASPLLGVPQGLSVYVDGVRVNEAFGDMVNWDLIPSNAIAATHLVSGANPAFGLNTLGGVLVLQTKSGFSFPGTSARIGGGSFGQRLLEAEQGVHGERGAFFISGRAFDDAGWREHSQSRLRQAFMSAARRDAHGNASVSLTLVEDSLHGTQALPVSMLGNPRQAYTWPDSTGNRLAFLNAQASRYLADAAELTGRFYLRTLDQGSFDSNVNDDGAPPAFNDRASLAQRMAGGAAQLVLRTQSGRVANELTLGASLDASASGFTQERQDATFSPDREAVPLSEFTPNVALNAHARYWGLYVIEQLTPAPRWRFTLSGRYNIASVMLRDASGKQPALDGDHRFSRFTPAAGMDWNPSSAVTAFASLGEGMRVPAPVELTCADPSAPCSLPNAFLADPPLKPVLARTAEAGLRLHPSSVLRLSASAYRSIVSDDIEFVSSSAAVNAGFFQNAGRTLRQGFDLAAQGRFARWNIEAAYSRVRAEYLTPFRMSSPNNSSSDAAGEIEVAPGDRIPGIPNAMLKLALGFRASERWSLGVGAAWFARQYARGDENNRDESGPLPSYAVARASARYRLSRRWTISAEVDNLFDRRYETFGVLGRNFFNGPASSFDPAGAAPELFASPGAPRSLWIAARYES